MKQLVSNKRAYVNNPDVFCYICGEYTMKLNRKAIFHFVRKAYLAYFDFKLGDQDKGWAPHIVCRMCTKSLQHWTCRKRRSLKLCVPMVWREPINHFDDCYFCAAKITGINKNNRQKWKYSDLASARRPVSVLDDIHIHSFHILQDISEDEMPTSIFDINSDYTAETSSPSLFNQNELNDLIQTKKKITGLREIGL